jgi:inhibitor of cysteine peptidase
MRFNYLMVYGLIIICIMGLSVTCDAATTSNVTNVNVGQEFSIVLACNPSTGYEWNASYNTQYLKLINQNYQPNYPILTGSGGNENFTFKALKAGNSTITFNYQQSWESTPIQTVTYDIQTALNPENNTNTTTQGNNITTPDNSTNSTITGNNIKNTETVPMQDTGVPLTGLALGIISVVGGLLGIRKN